MQRLQVFQSLWGMELRNPNLPERSKKDAFAMIAGAGFDGVSVDPAVHEIDECYALQPLVEKYELGIMVNAFPAVPDDMRALLQYANAVDARVVNVISGVMPIRPEDAVEVVRRWMGESDVLQLPILFETHRDGLLNDLYFTLQLMELVPEMRLCADLSHFVVDRELRLPVPQRDANYISDILDRSDAFQGRVANREQVQIQIDFPQHQPWVGQFKDWWREGIARWRQRNDADATLLFLCELGPPPYAITDAQQNELSDRWQESLLIRDWIREIWDETE